MRIIPQISTIVAFALTILLSSCQDSSDEPDTVTPVHQIVFLFSPGGLGDMGYNDCILTGLQRFKREHPQEDIFMYSPGSLDEAEGIFSDWIKRPGSNIHTMFVLASSDYEVMAAKYLSGAKLPDNKQVLLFESEKNFGPRTATFQISMYGASFLAAKTAAKAVGDTKALIVLANNTDGPIRVAKDGFMDGIGAKCDIEYLADDWTGFVSSSLAYSKMEDWSRQYNFIFPVAGGSNAGIYRYSREYADSPLLAGMDVDQSHLSRNITGSVLKHIDNLIFEYLSRWTETHSLPETALYGLGSGHVDWALSPAFAAEYGTVVESFRDDALAAEQKYLGKK